MTPKHLQLLVESKFNNLLGVRNNPFYREFLGPIIFFLFTVIFLTGAYLLFIPGVYLPSMREAYASVQFLTQERWFLFSILGREYYLGGVIKGIHRYGANLVLIAIALHGLRALLTGKRKGNRWLNWVTGIWMFIFTLIIGISGYWLVWDDRAQYIAHETTRIIDFLPFFSISLMRHFLTDMSFRTLELRITLVIHVALAFIVLAIFFLHMHRLTYPKILPKNKHWIPIFVLLVAMTFLSPPLSGPEADLSSLPTNIQMDWFYLFILPVIAKLPEFLIWVLIITVSAVLTAVPWISNSEKKPVSSVLSDKCTGCRHCYNDCPYEAIRMVDREGEKEDVLRQEIATINKEKCSGCGQCFGACTYSAVEIGEYLGQTWDDATVKKKIRKLIKTVEGNTSILVISCENSVELDEVVEGDAIKGFSNAAVLPVRCSGMINPAMIQNAIKEGFDGVLISSCRIGDCYHRLGNIWLDERLNGERPPILKDNDLSERVDTINHSAVENNMFYDGLRRFEKHITNTEETEDEEETKKEPDRKKVIPVALGIATVLTISILFLSVAPPLSPYGTDSGKLAVTMHSDTPVGVSINVDGTTVVEETSNAIEIYEEIDVEPGQHAVSISAQGVGSNVGPYKYSDTISIDSGEFKMIDFDQKNGTFYTKNLKKVEKEYNPFKKWENAPS